MAFGAPTGAQLSYSTVAPPAVQAAQAATAAPQANADAAQKLAEAQAGKETAQAQGVQADLAKQQATDSILTKLTQTPGIEKSPMGVKMLTERLKTLGMEVPKDETGAIDMKAITAMITPPLPAFSSLSTAQYKDQLSRQPGDRDQFPGAPADWKTRSAETPLTDAGVNALMKPVTLAEAAIGKGNGNMQGLQTAALSAYKALKAKGGDTSVIDPYLNADHTGLSDEFKNQQAGQLVDAQISNLHSLGIYRADEAALRGKSIEEKKREFDNLGANQKAKLSLEQMKYRTQAAQFAQKLSMQQQNLTARYQSISNSANANSLRAGALGMNMYSNQVKDAEKAQTDAERLLTSTQNSINGYLNTANADLANPTYLNLVQQASDLNDQINGNAAKKIPSGKAMLQAARETANSGIANIYSGITGQQAAPTMIKIELPGGPPGQKFGSDNTGGNPMESKSKSGKPIVSSDGGQTWHYK